MGWIKSVSKHNEKEFVDTPLKATSFREAVGEVIVDITNSVVSRGAASFIVDIFLGQGGRKASIFSGGEVIKIKWVKDA